jgi:DNA polymerase III subunit epsilon
MYLFFDTETTGLPKNWKAPVSDLNNWPRLVQLAWLQFSDAGELVSSGNFIVRPDKFSIPSDSAKIHGITNERAEREGLPLEQVMNDFLEKLGLCQVIVAHNMSFDIKIVGAELMRLGRKDLLSGKKQICTMQAATEYCAIPGYYGYKWPKLSELHTKLFGTGFDEAHNAAVDIMATSKCFWEMKKIGLFKTLLPV